MTTPLLYDSWSDSTAAETYANTTERPLESIPLYIAQQYIRNIYSPIMFLFGIFGNVMIICIMRRTTSGESAFHIYFIGMAVFDMIVVCTSLGRWLRYAFDFDIRATHSVVCKIYTWLYTGSSTISAWYLVCMTVHRAMSVVWPHRVNALCTRRTVLLLLTGITVFFALLYSHYMIGKERVFMVSENKYRCSTRHDDENYIYFMEKMFVYIELSIFCVLPFTFLAVTNSVLVWELSVSVNTVKRHLNQKDQEKVLSREKAADSVKLTVIVVSLAFIVLTLPTSINFILNYFAINFIRSSGYEFAKISFTNTVCHLLGETNSAVNFYLYILTGRRFREEFLRVMCCGRNRRMDGASSVTEKVTKQSTR